MSGIISDAPLRTSTVLPSYLASQVASELGTAAVGWAARAVVCDIAFRSKQARVGRVEIEPDLDRDHDPHGQTMGLRVGDGAHPRKMTGT